MKTLISKTRNGSVVKTKDPSDYYVEFFSSVFVLNYIEYKELSDAVYNIDDDYWVKLSLEDDFRRKIKLPLSSKTISLHLTKDELLEFKRLLIPEMKLYRSFKSEALGAMSILAYYN